MSDILEPVDISFKLEPACTKTHLLWPSAVRHTRSRQHHPSWSLSVLQASVSALGTWLVSRNLEWRVLPTLALLCHTPAKETQAVDVTARLAKIHKPQYTLQAYSCLLHLK